MKVDCGQTLRRQVIAQGPIHAEDEMLLRQSAQCGIGQTEDS